jgi:predicted RNase H-like HicB family nuclease
MVVLHQRVGGQEFRVLMRPWRNGAWMAECLGLRGCVSEGATEREAITNMRTLIGRRLLEEQSQRDEPHVTYHMKPLSPDEK